MVVQTAQDDHGIQGLAGDDIRDLQFLCSVQVGSDACGQERLLGLSRSQQTKMSTGRQINLSSMHYINILS